MRLVDQLRFGPFAASYHQNLVTAAFTDQLETFLQKQLVPQLDSPLQEVEGTCVATFNSESYCGTSSLVRNIFTLDCDLFSDDGVSQLKSDIVYDPATSSFAARTGHNRWFYVWTPTRKIAREKELAAIQRAVDDVYRNAGRAFQCPLCAGDISSINSVEDFYARCEGERCFNISFHKDDRGRPVHGHFFTKHPPLPR
jgi:hypothetical protein